MRGRIDCGACGEVLDTRACAGIVEKLRADRRTARKQRRQDWLADKQQQVERWSAQRRLRKAERAEARRERLSVKTKEKMADKREQSERRSKLRAFRLKKKIVTGRTVDHGITHAAGIVLGLASVVTLIIAVLHGDSAFVVMTILLWILIALMQIHIAIDKLWRVQARRQLKDEGLYGGHV